MNQNSNQTWYDPYAYQPWAAAAYPGEPYPQYEVYVGAAPSYPPSPWSKSAAELGHQIYGAAQDLGQGLSQAFGMPSPSSLQQKADDLHQRASAAADSVQTTAKAISKTADAANASIDLASSTLSHSARQMDDAAKAAQQAAYAIQFAVIALGVLGSAALVFYLVRQVSD